MSVLADPLRQFLSVLKQAIGLIKIDRMRHVRRDVDITLAWFGDSVTRKVSSTGIRCCCNARANRTVSVPPQLWPKRVDDLRLASFGRIKDAVAVGVQKAEDVTERLLSGVIAKHPHLDSRGITVAQTRGEFHLGMSGIVMLDGKAASKPDNDYFV